MTRDNEYYENGVKELTDAIAAGIPDRDEMNRATRNLIHFHIRLEQYETAKDLLRKHFNFNRKDLLNNISLLCRLTEDTSIAEELIGEIRCYAYTWLEFCVDMQQLYMNAGEVEKATELQHSIIECAFMSLRPATKAIARSLSISGNISDSYILKNLYKETKRIHKELT
ncbi:MAG: hypothetical protein IJZ68_07560 [Bacteroidaceae bacterium]|nr:hypothetical protein [Bacteroidaceae bacterium]